MTGPVTPKADAAEILRAVQVFHSPGDVVELRALKVKNGPRDRAHVASGYYDDWSRLAADAADLSGKAVGVYLIPHRINPDLLAWSANHLTHGPEHTTSGGHVLNLDWLLIDLDPKRLTDTAATEAEHEASHHRAHQVFRALSAEGWPAPVALDSGNGYWLAYAIDLPNERASTDLVKHVLTALDLRFSDDVIVVDQSLDDAAQLARMPGTLNRKGDALPERPHRLARLLHVPDPVETVSRGLLEALAARVPREVLEPPSRPRVNGYYEGFDVHEFMGRFFPDAGPGRAWQGNGWIWSLPVCPWNADHTGSAYAGQHPNGGAYFAGCHHNSCTWGWAELREKYEPDYRERRNGVTPTNSAKNAKERQEKTYDGVRNSGGLRASKARLIRLSEVVPTKVRWLWPGRIPLAKTTIIDGDPGLGKSLITVDLAARVTAGRSMPDGATGDQSEAAGVVFLTAEDGLSDTVVPRLMVAGGNCTKVVALDAVVNPTDQSDDWLPTVADIDALREAIAAVRAVLVVIDPLMAYLPDEVNSYRDQDIRRALRPVARLAEETGAAIVFVRHLNKSAGSKALYRGGGSIGIVGAARSGMVVAEDPNDADKARRILAVTKPNLAAPAPAMAYRVAVKDGQPYIEWEGITEDMADDLLIATVPTAEDRSSLDDACAVLQRILADGAIHAKDGQQLAREAGVAWRTLDRARAALGVKSKRIGGLGKDGYWQWELPNAAKKPNTVIPLEAADLGGGGVVSTQGELEDLF